SFQRALVGIRSVPLRVRLDGGRERRLDDTGTDGVHAHAERAEFGRAGAHQLHDARLGHRVHRLPGLDDLRPDRREDDDAAASLMPDPPPMIAAVLPLRSNSPFWLIRPRARSVFQKSVHAPGRPALPAKTAVFTVQLRAQRADWEPFRHHSDGLLEMNTTRNPSDAAVTPATVGVRPKTPRPPVPKCTATMVDTPHAMDAAASGVPARRM